jgi:hypothetical protein
MSSPRGEGETTVVEGTYFSFGGEGVEVNFGGTEASDATGVGLLGLAFAFFERGSINHPHCKQMDCYVKRKYKSTSREAEGT